jgi:ATP-dependent DNA helicase RecG
MKPEMDVTIKGVDWRLETLPGVGAKTLASFEDADIYNIWQLLCHCPARYEDYTTLVNSNEWSEHIGKEAVLIEGPVAKTWSYFSAGKRSTYCQIQADACSVRVGFFHLHPQVKKKMEQEGASLRCYGKLVLSGNCVSMYHPKYWIIESDNPVELEQTLTPVYKNIAGVSSARLKKIMLEALKRVETVDSFLVDAADGSMSIGKALLCIHKPGIADFVVTDAKTSKVEQAKWRLAQEEAVFWSMLLAKESEQTKKKALACAMHSKLCLAFIKNLPFDLTADQNKAVKDIQNDLTTIQPMSRLLQGDVGCGKTVVATIAMLQAVDAGYQAVLLAPTVVLAKQHAKKLAAWLAPLGVKTELLISEDAETLKSKKKKIKAGEVSIVIGTHAVLTEDVCFKHLALAIIDEQHRFGVKQRETLIQKGAGDHAHTLMMSATPIPQSLAQSFFGVTDCSSIKTLPNDRMPIQTSLLSSAKRDALLKRVIEQAQVGKQIYWICPRVDKADDGMMSATALFEKVNNLQSNASIALLHGRMKSDEKMAILERFSQGDIKLLVSTVVVEVGVDVPAATIMVIDQAQIFGLAQLHQLRGRVGRSDQQGYCVLLYDAALTEEGIDRLQSLKDSTDGFELAEKDLQMRGPGQIIGFKQSGYPAWRFLQWPDHRELLANKQACDDASLAFKNGYLIKLLWGQKSKA